MASQERKNFIQTMELQRQHNEPLNDLEEEAKERAQHLLERANEQRQEQEDEIKHLNEVLFHNILVHSPAAHFCINC